MRTASLRNETIEPTTTRMGQMAASVDYRRARTSTQSSSAKTSSTQSPAPPTASANSLAVQTKNQRFPRGMSSAHPVTPLILTDALMGAPDLATRASSPSAIAAWSRGRWIKEALPTRHQKKLMPVAVTAARAYRCCSSRRANDGLTIWPACNCRSCLGAGHIRVEKPRVTVPSLMLFALHQSIMGVTQSRQSPSATPLSTQNASVGTVR
jgi:hypothetical protein